jgi:hypothetical protein
VGRRSCPGAAGFSDSADRLGRHGEEEEWADRRGPLVSERKREKALLLECTNLKRMRLLANAPWRHRPSGLRGLVMKEARNSS